MNDKGKSKTARIAIVGSIVIGLVLVLGTYWMGSSARRDNERAARTVSLLYLDELAGRREQVVWNNLQTRIRDMRTAVGLMEEEDVSDMEHLQAYQYRMKQLYNLDKFAFVDEDGLIYTSNGTQENIGEYNFDYQTISEPEISILNLQTKEKKVVIALPVEMLFQGKQLKVCFMEIDMNEMLSGVSMNSNPDDATFCNIYTYDGIALSNTILGGLAVEDNLLEAMQIAEFENDYTYERFLEEFKTGQRGEVSFTYKGIKETLSYIPVENTDWVLTYLIRESVISDSIGTISQGIINRSIIQSGATVLAMLAMFGFIISETRRNAHLVLERETAEAEVRGKQEELDQRIALQKQLEQQSEILKEALTEAEQANKAKTAFLSNMSHEIRTPMNAIIGLDNIALNDKETPEKTKVYLRKIEASAEHLLSLINDILDMSRIESGRLTLKNEEFSFSKLIEAINTMFATQCQDKGLEYQCHINGHVNDYYIGDNMKLRQILINILGNAVKFTPEGGSVDFSVKEMAKYDNKSTLQFTISDTGIGISEEFLPHLFDAFTQEDSSTTSKYGSSGLGLAITKNIVEMMNGNIQVESEKGKGTTFIVTVTLNSSERINQNQVNVEINPAEMSVLIVDDDPIACEHAKLVLEKAGIASETADSGKKAVEMVQLHQARRKPYNLILIDWKMPEMDGIETTKKIREITGDVSAIIILTAYRWDEILEEAIQAGVDSFIAKPLFANAVIEEFKTALEHKQSMMKTKEKKAELKGRRILLAEDVEINAEIMKMLLQSREIESELAVNGKIAVDLFKEHPEGYYDAVLMDMRMPEMDGLEATRIIRSLDRQDAKSIPIIALTANAFDEDVQRSLQAGLNAHLSKPIQPEVLFETLESLIKD